MFDRPSPSARFRVTWRVNGQTTCVMHNLPATRIWDEAVPTEALRPETGQRWHVMMKYAILDSLANLPSHQELSIAWQDPSTNGADTEHISVAVDDG